MIYDLWHKWVKIRRFFSPPLFLQQQPTCSIIIVIVGGKRAAGRLRPWTRVGRRRAPARCRRHRGVATCTRCGARVARRRLKDVRPHSKPAAPGARQRPCRDWLTGRRRRPATRRCLFQWPFYFLFLTTGRYKKNRIRSRIFIWIIWKKPELK
jgi:hypothetical protein